MPRPSTYIKRYNAPISGQEALFTSSHRFGFNGKESDSEVKGEGNQQDYGFRIYDPRISKFLSVDPLTKEYPWYTPYQFAGNKPIEFIDLDGLEEAKPDQIKGDKNGNPEGTITASDNARSQTQQYQKFESNKVVGPSTDPRNIRTPSPSEVIKNAGTILKDDRNVLVAPESKLIIESPVFLTATTGAVVVTAAPVIATSTASATTMTIQAAEYTAVLIETNTAVAMGTGVVVGTANAYYDFLPQDYEAFPGNEVATIASQSSERVVGLILDFIKKPATKQIPLR